MQKRCEDILKFGDITINFKMKAFIITAVSHKCFKVRWLPSIYCKVCEDLFAAEVKRLNETNSIPESTATSSSAGDFYESNSGSNDSFFTVEARHESAEQVSSSQKSISQVQHNHSIICTG